MSEANDDRPSSEAQERVERAERAPITLRVDYKRLNTFFADYTKNISKGGTFIRTTRPLEIGTEFMFVLTVPSVPPPSPAGGAAAQPPAASNEALEPVQLELSGVVKWIVREEEATPDRPPGMGIQFVFSEDSERQNVEALVGGMMKDSLGERLAQKLLGRS